MHNKKQMGRQYMRSRFMKDALSVNCEALLDQPC